MAEVQRKQAEEKLSTGDAILRVAFESAISGVGLLSTDGIITFANPALYQMLGYAPSELEGQHIDAITHQLDLRFTSSMFRRALAGELKKLSFENRFLHKNGEIIWAQVSGSLVETGDRTRFFVIYIRDITEPLLAATRLRQSEEKYSSLFENIPDGVYRATLDGALLTANPALVRMLGFESEDELKQTSVYDLYFDPQDREDFINLASRDGDVRNREVRMRRRDGQELYTLNNARAFRDKNGAIQFIEGTLSDITARKQAEAALQKQLERLNALRTIDETIIGSLDLKVTLNVLLEQITSQLKADACKILLYSEQSRLLRYGASKGFRTEAINQATQRSGETFSSRVARERISLLIPDISKEPGSIFQGPALVGEDFVTYLGVPLIAKAQVKGVLEIFMRSAFEPNDEWTGLLEMMSGLAAISIDNAALFEGLQRSNFDLAMAYDTTLEGWSHALDLRDKETEGHSRRVAELTMRMAQAYGFSDRELVQVRRGALLHDIGKMGLPDSILLKRGALSLTEWAIMRKHPVYAYELLSPIKYLQLALEIPYCHHERWDGSGYPRGLKETQIPLAARMFAIVDVYDALTSNRPYRSAWSEEKTFAYIRSLAGHQFDPQMVELFFKVIS